MVVVLMEGIALIGVEKLKSSNIVLLLLSLIRVATEGRVIDPPTGIEICWVIRGVWGVQGPVLYQPSQGRGVIMLMGR